MIKTINININDELLVGIDIAVQKHGYATRSEFIRDAIRQYMIMSGLGSDCDGFFFQKQS
jgi:metal-responsive CopG/Arc/MetJ family transcriptional regulator